MERELRQRRVELLTLGSGVIAFSVWSVLRTVLYFWISPLDISQMDVPAEYQAVVLKVIYIMVALLMAADFALRVYVGRSARAEGLGEHRGRTYIVLAAVMLVLNAAYMLYLPFHFWEGKLADQSNLDYIVSLIVELSSLAVLGDLLYTALRVRKLKGETEG